MNNQWLGLSETKRERTTMYNTQFIFQKFETADHRSSYPSQDILWDASALEFVKRSSVHVFHAVINAGFNEKSPIKLDYLRSNCTMQDIEFHNDSV
jgi:hypothetical protein